MTLLDSVKRSVAALQPLSGFKHWHCVFLICYEPQMLCAFQFVSGFGFLCSILAAPPTAELEPLTDGQVSQTDEVGNLSQPPFNRNAIKAGLVSLLKDCWK